MGSMVLRIVVGAIAVAVVLGALRMLGTGGVESPTLLVDLCAVLGIMAAIFAIGAPDGDRHESRGQGKRDPARSSSHRLADR